MREIKFRQWNPKRKSFQYGIGASKDCWTSPVYVNWGKHPLTQFTGLHDNNGKKIWEGDILLTPGKFKLEVKIDNIGHGDPKFFNIGFDLCEVIGNIYENPELMEGR